MCPEYLPFTSYDGKLCKRSDDIDDIDSARACQSVGLEYRKPSVKPMECIDYVPELLPIGYSNMF